MGERRNRTIDPQEEEYWSAAKTLAPFSNAERAYTTLIEEAPRLPLLVEDVNNFRGKIEALHQDPTYKTAKKVADDRREAVWAIRQNAENEERGFIRRLDQSQNDVIGGAGLLILSLTVVFSWVQHRFNRTQPANRAGLTSEPA